jgi:uncharacterized SAM-dependent methyltransferase
LNLLKVCLDNHLRFMALFERQACMVRQANLRCKPELGLTIRVRNMDMNARFFAGKEKKSELSVSYNCRRHRANCTAASHACHGVFGGAELKTLSESVESGKG